MIAQQHRHNLWPPARRRVHERSTPILVGLVYFLASVQKSLQDLGVVLSAVLCRVNQDWSVVPDDAAAMKTVIETGLCDTFTEVREQLL